MSGYVLPRLAAHDIPHGSLMNAVVLTHSGLRFTSIDTCTNSANVVRNQATFPCAKLFRHISKIIRMGAEKQVIGPNAQPHVTGVAHEQGRVANRPVMQFIRKAMRRYDGYLRAKVDATVARFFVRFAGPQPAGVSLTHSRPEPLFGRDTADGSRARMTAIPRASLFLFPLRQVKGLATLLACECGPRSPGPGRTSSRAEIAVSLLQLLKERKEIVSAVGALVRNSGTWGVRLTGHHKPLLCGVSPGQLPLHRASLLYQNHASFGAF